MGKILNGFLTVIIFIVITGISNKNTYAENQIQTIGGRTCSCTGCACVKKKCTCNACSCDRLVVTSEEIPDASVPPQIDGGTSQPLDSAVEPIDAGVPASEDAAVSEPDSEVLPPEDAGATEPDVGPPFPNPTPNVILPTFVDLNWEAFPIDPGPNYVTSGKILVVKKTGNDSNLGTEQQPFLTINKAVSVSSPGDIVKVYSGVYKEAIKEDYRALVLNKENLILTAAPGEAVTIEPGSGYKYGIEISASGIILNGISLNGFTYAVQIGEKNKSQKNVIISNLNITASSSSAEGIIAYYNTANKGFATSDGLLIKNVVISGAGMGISCDSGPCHSWRVENVKVLGAGGSSWGADGIAIENGENLLFHQVEVAGFGADGIDTKAKKVVVWGCHIHNLKKNGVKLWYGGDIVNTIIHNTGADASVVTEYGPRIRLLHSIIAFHNYKAGSSYNMTFGYDSNEAQQVDIVNSIIYKTSGGAYINKNSKLNIENSLFFGMENGNILSYGNSDVTIGQGVSGLAQFGSGNIVANPQLNEITFELKSTSPGINKGKKLSVNYPDFDILGRPRVKSGVCDISPFEGY